MERQTIEIIKPVDEVIKEVVQIINAISGRIEEQNNSFLFWTITDRNHHFQCKIQWEHYRNITQLTTFIFTNSSIKHQNDLINTLHNYLLQDKLDYSQIPTYKVSQEVSPSKVQVRDFGSKNKFGFRKILYYALLIPSVLFFFFLLIHIGKCEEESYGDISSGNIIILLLLSVLFLVIELVVFSIDGLILLIKKIQKTDVNNSELYCLGVAFILFIIWFVILGNYSNNGTCDSIIGPADTGLFLAMGIAVIINFWKVNVIKNNQVGLNEVNNGT